MVPFIGNLVCQLSINQYLDPRFTYPPRLISLDQYDDAIVLADAQDYSAIATGLKDVYTSFASSNADILEPDNGNLTSYILQQGESNVADYRGAIHQILA
jgi:hypothetical protein